MATPETIPLAELLAPIAGEAPAGSSVRADTAPGSLYYAIKDARAAARAAERSALQLGDLKAARQADWDAVLKLAPRILRERAKDLEISAWYIEALVRRRDFAGLRDGFKLARLLIENFWDTLHPLPDEDGMATRMAPLVGLNGDESEGTLIVPIGLVALTEQGEFSTWHYLQSGELARVTDPALRQQRIEAGAVPMESIVAAIAATSPEFLRARAEDLAQCIGEVGLLSQALDSRLGANAPTMSSIVAALGRAQDALNFLAKGVLGEKADPGGAQGENAAADVQRTNIGGPVKTRDEALRALAQIAEFFRRTEPHSPVPYGIERAVRWAGLPLPALVEELIPDNGARNEFQKLTGVQLPGS